MLRLLTKSFLILLLLLSFHYSFGAYISDFDPVSHWSCDEISGVRYDSTVSSNDLTDNNTVSYQTGLLNNACDFELTNSEYLSITDASQSGLEPSDFSASFWLYRESTGNTNTVLSKWGAGSAQYIIWINTSDYFYLKTYPDGTNNNDFYFNSYNGVGSGAWYHVVITFDSTKKISQQWVNGSYKQTVYNASAGFSNQSSDFRLGSYTTNDGFFDGLIDEITFFNSVLSTSTIESLYNSGTPLEYECVSDCGGTSTSTATTTSVNFEDDNIVFALAVIVFFLALIFTGFVFNAIRKR